MPNKRIDQLEQANINEVGLATKLPISVNTSMKSASLSQLKTKIIEGMKTINGTSLDGSGDIIIGGSSMIAGGETTIVQFSSNRYYGSSTNPVAGNITYDFTNAQPGTNVVIFHYSSTAPTFSNPTYKLDYGIYVPNALNIITLLFISTDAVLVNVHPTTNIGLTTEVQSWLNKGGVADGYMLTVLNDLALGIQPFRSKLLRLNFPFGYTFSSAFIPLVVNDDNGVMPLGYATDSNYNIGSDKYKMLGTNAGFYYNGQRYIDTGFCPSLQNLFGQNDCSIGLYGVIGLNGLEAYIGNDNISIGYQSAKLNNITADSVNIMNTFGLHIIKRDNSNNYVYSFNGTPTTISRASAPKSVQPIKVGHLTNWQVTTINIQAYIIGKHLTASEETMLRDLFIVTSQKLGRI